MINSRKAIWADNLCAFFVPLCVYANGLRFILCIEGVQGATHSLVSANVTLLAVKLTLKSTCDGTAADSSRYQKKNTNMCHSN